MSSVSIEYVLCSQLRVHPALHEFVETALLPGTGVDSAAFWQGFSDIVHSLAPRNRVLLARRDFLQQQIDLWHQQNPLFDITAYKAFLQKIDYLVRPSESFKITTQNVDPEIATLAGPQLVVPVTNARFALNACNARWGSLYDALYGTDVIEEDDGAERGGVYNPVRGARVVDFGRDLLDVYFPLRAGSYHQAQSFQVAADGLAIFLADGSQTSLADPQQFCGFQGPPQQPSALLLRRHGLHLEIQINPSSRVGAQDKAGIHDLVLESALTTIMDCEDSVAAVDAEDKILAYRNWLGLMQGTLTERVNKNGETFIRTMNPDRIYSAANGETFAVPGRSLLFVRNVGHLMMTNAILDRDAQEIPEGIMDGVITATAALHDLQRAGTLQNSRSGSVYIVKPKMHGPEEVAFTDTLFARIEDLLELRRNTLKMGIMDEERRTTINLMECIRAAKDRVVFINTGFLDRTGDEIHTSMEAGAFAPKNQLKTMPWINAYERWNVSTGLACGLHGKAQIGKGMWAQPDNMAAMIQQKIVQPKAGATTAWVPSPTAATLHAIHYLEVDVANVQKELLDQLSRPPPATELDTILTIPLLGAQELTAEEIQRELENNCQSILGYVVRWIQQGIGCSKVPDIHNTPLMEDRATLRISSQHIANWLHHNICSAAQVSQTLEAMAKIVDQQNAADPLYKPMATDFDNSLAFAAAKDLIFLGREQPNGYTDPLLHSYRQRAKNPNPPQIVFAAGRKKACGYVPDA